MADVKTIQDKPFYTQQRNLLCGRGPQLVREKVEVAFQLAIIFAVLLAFQPLPVHAAATLIQQNSAGCSDVGCEGAPPVVVSFPSSVASGNVIVVGVVTDGTVDSVSDSKGSTFAQAVSATAYVKSVYIYVAPLSSSGSDTVTVTFSATEDPSEEVVYIYEVSGVTTTGAGTGTGSGSGTSMSTSSVAFLSGAFLLGIIGTGSVSATAGAGFTLSPAPSGTSKSHAEYATSGVSSPTTFPATVAVQTDWVEVGVALNPAEAPPAPVGGDIVSVNQFLVALPWLTLFAVLGVAVVGAYVVGQRKRK